MPRDIDVYGSTLREHTHKGPNQAGNKSMLSYRSDIGVPGYTGFIPAHAAIVVPIKGFEHTGKPVDAAFNQTATLATVEPEKAKISEYAQEYKKVPSDTKRFSKTGGGYWFGQRTLSAPKPFIASTAYQAEVLNSESIAAQQLDRTQGLTCTLSGYEVARQRAHSAQATSPGTGRVQLDATQRPATSMTTKGEVVGYQTTYRRMVVDDPLIGGSAAAGNKSSAPFDSSALEQRYQVMPRAMAPGMFGEQPTYRMDFGEDGSDPMERTAPGEKFQTRLATTRDLSEGTTRNTNHPPGYTGHLPASKHHHLARAHADAADERINAKNDMTLYALDQFSRTRLPHCTTYKPQAPSNITLAQPSQGANTATVYGHSNHVATRNGVPPVDNTYYNNSRTGIMSYFHSAGEYISDNGLANAETYFKTVRPGDGRFKMAIPSKATSYGSTFKASNSLV